ncbi:MAG: glycosyltransferase 87 family protein [Candidatus Eremiobacteraeota bacterium]|nr:glycosyltransferase 87 family protein [Candidatus Eremiobacteraeota bacterium]
MPRVALAVAVLAYALAVLAFRPHRTPGPALRDFEAYYAAGVAFDQGEDPYGRAIWRYERTLPGVDERREGLLPFVNPPPLLLALGLLARMPFGAAAALWESLLVLALGALLIAVAALAGVRDAFGRIALVPFALAFGPISSDLALGQFALFAVAALAIGAWALASGRSLAGGASAYLAAMQPTLALPLVAFARSWRALHALVASAAVFALGWIVLAAQAPVAAPLTYFAVLRAHDAAERFALIQYAPSSIVYGLGAGTAIATACGIAIALGALLVWLLATLRLRLAPLASFLLACTLLPFVVPFFHEHDFALLAIPALYVLRRTTSPLARAIATAGALLCAIDWLGLAQRPDGWIQSLLLACAFFAAAIAASGVRIDRSLVVPFGAIAGALLICVLVAQSHPAPVWPDAMALPLHALPNATAAEIWHTEQAAAHMFDFDAFHALLRALPLLGCAALAWATIRLPKAPSDSRNP